MTEDNAKTAVVPARKLSRLARLGGLAGGVLGGMVAEGARQFSRGNRPVFSELILTPANARRVAQKLAHLRGAAMKVGQLLSMDAGEVLPPEFAEVLARLRAEAQPMPMSQLVAVVEGGWGKGWENRFERFSFTSLAAASIGQVHEAITTDGKRLALKIQYPGIRESIDSDVDNVATLLRVVRLLPDGLALDQLFAEAKRQLHLEADYLTEAQHMKRFRALLACSENFRVPAVDDTLTRRDILTMEFLEGEPIQSLTDAKQGERDRVAGLLIELFFRELFEFRLIQSDPNFANFLYDPRTQTLGLLDFGATREFSRNLVDGYRDLLRAAARADRQGMTDSARRIGYFEHEVHPQQREAVLEIFLAVTEPIRSPGPYDFGSGGLAKRILDAVTTVRFDRGNWHTLPVDVLFLHRKLAGLYLLASRLRARVRVDRIFARYLSLPRD